MASDRDILPDTVKPSHYSISLYDLELGGEWSYQGTVAIDLEIKKSTKEIVLNSLQLKIHSAELKTENTKTEQNFKASDITYDAHKQRVTLAFGEEPPATSKATLVVKFQGTMNNLMAGFYRSRYKPTGSVAKSVPQVDDFHYMFSTQFESCDARRAFPCFDEPNLKATFDVDLEIPKDQVALSNMPEKKKKETKEGWHVVSFERTPIMSTYLLAWAVGDFEYVEDRTDRKYNGARIPVRVYTTRGLRHQGQFALENAKKIVDLFSDIFKIDYPLPKVDLIAVHEFSHGAMENWGLITYRTTAVLFDEAESAQGYKNRVAYVVAHELAHQWFGNLVTMDWWNELWLNEGFATWVGWYAIDRLYPEWNVWGQFVSEGVQSAFQLDSLRTSHPIEVPVKDALEVDQIFDAISYLKGSSVIRMLSAHLTDKVFLAGVTDYLNAHKYGNATTNDLWSALSRASGQDVNHFMDLWIRKIGFPVLTVAEEPGQISVKQERFLLTGDVKPEEDETTWWLPLGLTTGAPGQEIKKHSVKALTAKTETIRGVDDNYYKLNANQNGFYRTNYPPARLVKLGELKAKLSVEDKVGLIGDAYALGVSGYAKTTGFLALIERFGDETDYLVWSQITGNLVNIQSVFSDVGDVHKGLKKFALKLLTPAAEKVGWEAKKGETYLQGQLRVLLIGAAAAAGHEGIIKESLRRFELASSGKDPKAIPPSLRGAVFRTAVTEGGRAAYEALVKEYTTTTSIDGKEICLQSLGRVQTPELAQEFLTFLFSSSVAVQDKHSGAIALANNANVRYELWKYIRENWDQTVFPLLSGNMVVLERFLRAGLAKFASFEVAEEIREFFKDKDQRGYDRGLAVVNDTILGQATYRKRDEEVIREWLKANGYLE
ncbi:uncharacterized protein BDZ99DRAFT_497372 [Mytilinidion resinicola]|uniref:Aminopeptidase n=1 Tax=Mytilinidion resinicola TaxID=574789 RepID=A0A6A6YSC5_9PEZI|nr:uncharacterized protein BDZ99DRAFT_497372 [Mytilinidion resinicola]KAF2811700.1 hypothetical protein BDZ99DRAFT_497372 [Mytilinidion resinicola]